MTETEEYFPRGGKKPTTVFKQSANFLGAPEKTEKKKRKTKKKPDGDDGYLSDEETREIDQALKNCAVGLSFQTIKEGLSVLGRVRHIHETKMTVMLPSRIIGNVMACHISEPYNKMLEAYVNDQTDKVSGLSSLFRPGQYIVVKVLEVKERNLMLSTMPQHVNRGKTHADIVKGALFQAAVSSVEDHGYVMDLGILNTRAFLPKKNANPDIELTEGMVTWCSIKSTSVSAESCIVTVSNTLGAVQGAMLRRAPPTGLSPGSTVQFTVDTPLENGIEGTIFGDTTCYVQRQHVDKVKGKKPSLGQKITARVLYVMPTRNTPFLTMKNVFETSYPDLAEEQVLKEGDVVEDAQVIRITGRSIHFKLQANCFGTMSLKRVQIDEDLTDEQIVAKSYPIGSTHKVRVLCYYLSDYLYSVSDERDVVNEKYFSMSQFVPGQVVSGTVAAVNDGQVQLQLGRVTGFVPKTHTTETGIFVDPKKASTSNLPQKKYKVGAAVTARVLVVDLARHTLLLTLKRSLLAPDLQVLARYEDAVVGRAYTGVIRVIRDYLLVTFFNNVTAFVPRMFVTRDREQNLADAYHIGQIVTCTILNVHLETKKMSGSLTTAPFTADETKQKRKRNIDSDELNTKNKKSDEPHNEEDHSKAKRKRNDSEQSDKDKKKKKDKSKKEEIVEEHKISEESDAIETDFNDDEQILTPQEQGLLDMSDCNTVKDYKKRSVALIKGLEVRTRRLNVVDKKLSAIEEKGLDSKNKKYHTAMQTEKMLLQERIAKLLDGLNAVEVKLKDLGFEKNENYKEEQKKRKIERAAAKKAEKIEEQKKREKEIAKAEKAEKFAKKHKEEEENEEIDKEPEEQASVEDKKQARIEKKKMKKAERQAIAKQKKAEKQAFKEERKKAQKEANAEARKKKKAEKLAKKGLKSDNIDEDLEQTKSKKKEKVKTKSKIIENDSSVGELDVNDEVQQTDLKDDIETEKKETKQKKKNKKRKAETEDNNKKENDELDILSEFKGLGSLEPALDVPSVKNFWTDKSETLSKTVQEDESSSSDDESQDQPKKKRKKLSVAEKLAKAREEDERVRRLEAEAVAGETQPRSVDQFERALLAAPANSQYWIAYMAFHLQSTELDKARAVGRRALAAIPFREEGEKLNVWLALLNLEHRFGTKESQQKILEDGLQMNEPYKIHSALLDILLETGKQTELASLADLMVRKYKRLAPSYVAIGTACYRAGLVDKARQVMQKAVSLLEKKEHVQMLVQFALLEAGGGSRERAEALLERVLAVYPARVDVAAVYVDMLLKAGDVDRLRQLMERMTSLKLPARKMKVLYKKWIEAEEKIGDETQVEKIKQQAMKFIEKAKF